MNVDPKIIDDVRTAKFETLLPLLRRVGTLGPIVLRAINEVTGRHYWRIESFNDHHATDHAQVVEVLARARSDIAAAHSVALRRRPPVPVRWDRRMASWINRRGC
jgi:hypothetical protein